MATLRQVNSPGIVSLLDQVGHEATPEEVRGWLTSLDERIPQLNITMKEFADLFEKSHSNNLQNSV